MIKEASSRLMRGRTVIAIAHRLSTLRSFDRLIVLKAGKIIRDGSPAELMEVDDQFMELMRRDTNRIRRAA
jgi:ATP-binding cassette subfamily B protein